MSYIIELKAKIEVCDEIINHLKEKTGSQDYMTELDILYLKLKYYEILVSHLEGINK